MTLINPRSFWMKLASQRLLYVRFLQRFQHLSMEEKVVESCRINQLQLIPSVEMKSWHPKNGWNFTHVQVYLNRDGGILQPRCGLPHRNKKTHHGGYVFNVQAIVDKLWRLCTYCAWLRNPAPPWLKPYINLYIYVYIYIYAYIYR